MSLAPSFFLSHLLTSMHIDNMDDRAITPVPTDLAALASRLEEQFTLVISRQNIQDGSRTSLALTAELKAVAALGADVAELHAKLRQMGQPPPPPSASPSGSPPVPAVQAKLAKAKLAERAHTNGPLVLAKAPDLDSGLSRLEARMDRQDAQSWSL